MPAARAQYYCITLLLLAFSSAPALAQVSLAVDPTPVAPRTRLGIGVNGGGGWTNFVGAILVDDPSFEGATDANGFARDGWPWYTGGGTITASVDSSDAITGAQCQRVVVASAPASMSQGRADLPQAPLTMQARPQSTYRIRVQVRSDTPNARIQLGVVNEGWSGVYGPELTVGQGWQVVESTYTPAQAHLLRGITIRFLDAGTYWLDDLVAWDTTDFDPATGLSATFVARLRELAPESLRLGGLGVNGIPLEAYLRDTWPLSYGPPALQPDLDLNTFLRLCREVGAQPFLVVPPAFSDDTSWQVGDLTAQVLSDGVADHGNLIDYLGGDANTVYGARREADGFSRWDLEFASIYFELGNELWGTPDDTWDMDIRGDEELLEQMQNFVTYNQARMTEMRGRPGFRANMRLGFCGRGPTTWIGNWPGSYDYTVVPAIGSLTDFSTIDLYYGGGQATDSDELIFGTLFANAPKHEREIADMKAAFAAANGGVDIETTVYEGNATWGGYESDLSNPSPLYYKSVSQGAAVSLLDVYAASNRAGVTVNNHFHYGGNVWGATGPYPEVFRKPAFWALKLFNTETRGDLVGCGVSGGGGYDDPVTGEQAIPYVACYPYRDGDTIRALIINRHRTEARSVHIDGPLWPQRAVSLTAADINQNNEGGEQVTLQEQTLSGQQQSGLDWDLPAHSAVVLAWSTTGQVEPDGGDGSTEDGDGGLDDGDGGLDDGDAGVDDGDSGPADGDASVDDGDAGPTDGDALADGEADGGGGDEPGRTVEGSCGCGPGGGGPGAGALCLLALLLFVRRRRPSGRPSGN